MKHYVAAWQDPYTKEGKSLMFTVEGEKVIKTSPFMSWALSRPLKLVRKYFHDNGAAFYEVSK